MATAGMRHRLTAALGVDWERSPTGAWEIAGIPHAALERVLAGGATRSPRLSTSLNTRAGGPSLLDELRRVVTATRPAKAPHRTRPIGRRLVATS